ncbi:MAG: VanW family protein [Clostridiales bacterium]|nr:VanW family protein [Clostridiales bacterium]
MESNNKPKTDFFNRKAVKIIVSAAVLICAAILFYTAVITTGSAIAKGVSVNGVNIGGMSISDAVRILSPEADTKGKIITVKTRSGNKTEFSPDDISFLPDAQSTAESAYELTHSGNFLNNAVKRIRLYFCHSDIPFRCSADEEKLDSILYNLGIEQNGELKNYILDFSDDYVNVSRGAAGQSTDVSDARSTVLDALSRGSYDITVELNKSEPPVPDTESLFNEIYIAPTDARYEVTDGKVNMIAEQYGRQIDKIEAGTQIEKLKNGETITLKLVKLIPSVTLDTLNSQLFNHLLGEYSTLYSVSGKNRSKNVELAARKIDGVILAPDEVFSYNNTVGERTKANGFLEAPMFENGETVQGTGGGVCQVSSTLYSAVLYSDLQVVERRCHSLTVAYVPKGQDATVAYGSIDFKFKNNTAYPIKISAAAVKGKITVSISGTKPEAEKTVKITNNIIETREPTVEEVPDKSMLTGNKKVISAGKTGYTVETIRTVYENGSEVKSEKMGKSVYKMLPTKLAVGAAVPTPMPTLVPRETPTPEPEPTPDMAE